MVLSIKNGEADALARELARRRGKPITDTLIEVLKAEIARDKLRRGPKDLVQRILEIGRTCAALPELDHRKDDEILGYDENGLFR